MNKILICVIPVLLAVCIISFQNQAYADLSTSRLSQIIAMENHVYVTWDKISNGITFIMFAESSDYGTTFGKTTKLANDIGIAIPRKMAAAENNVYLAWGTDTQNSHQVFLRKSTDYGNTFGSTISLSEPNTSCTSVTGLQAAKSSVYVFFNCYDMASQEGNVVFRASHDNATTFEKPVTLFKGKGIASNELLSTAVEEKYIYVSSEQNFPVSTPDSVFFRKSVDVGKTFSDVTDLSSNKNSHVFPQILSNENHVYVVWRDYDGNSFYDLVFRKSDDYGNTFGKTTKLNTDKPNTDMYNIPFLAARGNRVYVSWEEIHQLSTQTQYQLLRTSTDGGNTFGPEQNLTGIIPMNYDLQQGGLGLGVGQNMYYLYPGLANPVFDISGIFFKKSADGGKTFGIQTDLNKLNYNLRDMYSPQMVVSDNNVYVAGDTADRGAEIFFIASHDNGTSFGKMININKYKSETTTVQFPLLQVKNGVSPQNVKCQQGLELVIKTQNNFPACVRHYSLPRMLSHGWIYGVSDIAEQESKKTQEILTIGDMIPGSNLVPVTTTEITNSTKPIDSITAWNFLTIRHDADNIHKTWEILPRNYSKFYEITDGHGNDIIDTAKFPEPFGVTLELRIYPVICGSDKVMGEGGHPVVAPIKKDNHIVYVKNAEDGMLPDTDGKYTIQFVSLFETKVEMPKNAKIISNNTTTCFLEGKLDNFTKAFYTEVIFKMD